MATSLKNLSVYDPASIPDCSDMKFGIVVSEWNELITQSLAQGAIDTLIKHGTPPENIYLYYVPGSFELPLGGQFLFESANPDAVILIGCVIQGETRHFDFICQAVARGCMELGLKFNKPSIFGVLTTDNLQQAIDRSGGVHGNKGIEAAVTALKMVNLSRDAYLRVGSRITSSSPLSLLP
jgi:6,7-dimethyl-8-ribityllumazine synthase